VIETSFVPPIGTVIGPADPVPRVAVNGALTLIGLPFRFKQKAVVVVGNDGVIEVTPELIVFENITGVELVTETVWLVGVNDTVPPEEAAPGVTVTDPLKPALGATITPIPTVVPGIRPVGGVYWRA